VEDFFFDGDEPVSTDLEQLTNYTILTRGLE